MPFKNNKNYALSFLAVVFFVVIVFPNPFSADLNQYVVSNVRYKLFDTTPELSSINLDLFETTSKNKISTNDRKLYLSFDVRSVDGDFNDSAIIYFTPPINHLQLWRKKGESYTLIDSSGIKTALDKRSIESRYYAFHTEITNRKQEYIAVLDSPFPVSIHPKVLAEKDFWNINSRDIVFFAIYLGIVSAVLLINLFFYFWTRIKIYLVYSILLSFSQIIGVLGIYGFTNYYFIRNSPQISLHILLICVSLMVISAVWFCCEYFKVSDNHKYLSRVAKSFYFAGVIFIVVSTFHVSTSFQNLIDLFSVAAVVFVILVCIKFLRANKPKSLYFLISYGTFCIGSLIFVLREQGIIPDSDLTTYSMLFGALTEALLFAVLLAIRFDVLRKELSRSTGDLSKVIDASESADNPSEYSYLSVPKALMASILYMDTVRFSEISKRLDPVDFFLKYRTFVNFVRDVIRRHGGVFDGLSGDAILCYFIPLANEETVTDSQISTTECSESRALRCAIEIQSHIASFLLTHKEIEDPCFILRFGISRDLITVGDIGDSHSLEVTGIGDGINFAARLEASSSPLKILVSNSFLDGLGEAIDKYDVYKKLIKVKHLDELVETYEISPKSLNSAYEAINSKILKYFGKNQLDLRQHVAESKNVIASTSMGNFRLVNISNSGFKMISADIYLANGVEVEFEELFVDGEEVSIPELLLPVLVLVVWNRVEGNMFAMGVQIIGMQTINRRIVYDAIEELL